MSMNMIELTGINKIYLETHRDLLVVEDATLEQAKKFFHDRGIETAGGIKIGRASCRERV